MRQMKCACGATYVHVAEAALTYLGTKRVTCYKCPRTINPEILGSFVSTRFVPLNDPDYKGTDEDVGVYLPNKKVEKV